ncbi:MAG: AAA family ATPase [Clostridiales bacterium]|jgi:CO dehydrogenase maturation factor|nr:AAA family ATPase [Clostridiales bacterium]
MKIAITGKGGVGKTTVAAVLARLYARAGNEVLAVDADPDANLGAALGFGAEELGRLTPVAMMSDLIAERTGAPKGGYGTFFKINPRVSDIPERFALEKDGVRFLVMGTVETGGGGCVCPEHVVLRRLMSHLIVGDGGVVILDMEAGLEHLGRGTAGAVDQFVVVVEPGERSFQTYERIRKLAGDLGVARVSLVANKVRGAADEAFVAARAPRGALLGTIRYDADLIGADQGGAPPYDAAPGVVREIGAIKGRIDAERGSVALAAQMEE